MTSYSDLKSLHTELLLLNKKRTLTGSSRLLEKATQLLINGQYVKLIQLDPFKSFFFENQLNINTTKAYISKEIDLGLFLDKIIVQSAKALSSYPKEVQQTLLLIISVLFLQLFVQSNFTGPKVPFDEKNGIPSFGFINLIVLNALSDPHFRDHFQSTSLNYLSLAGQQPYILCDSPLFLLISLRILEILQESPISLLNNENGLEPAAIASSSNILSKSLNKQSDIVMASIYWWRERALQIQQSLFDESSPILTTLSNELLTSQVVGTFIDESNLNSDMNQGLLVIFHLESSKNAIAADIETQSTESLSRARKVSGLDFVLTGCKAKRTKFQASAHAALTVLAKSQETTLKLYEQEDSIAPQDVKLNDEVFLERLHFESLGDNELLQKEENQEDSEIKRIKIDYSNYDESSNQGNKLLPIAIKQEDIPTSLTELDPNNQPSLSNLDNIQLLLRLETIKANTPMNDELVNEELIALVQRVLFSPDSSVNWLIFSRALWLRSLLETTRPRTVERGVLQLYSLVEELGMTSDKTARLFPVTEDELTFNEEFLSENSSDSKILTNAKRSRYLYLLPAMPKWAMDSQLAQKLVELGSLKSALEIYERLEQWTEAAMCHASIGNGSQATELLEKQISYNPNDAKALCIYGDIKQDPSYWEKAWKIGKYANAKRSLAKYYYNPPKESGLTRDYEKVLEHQYDCLSANPINFGNWYFYGCLGLEILNYELAAEAFSRCVTLDETSIFSWSNLASALLKLDKTQEAFNALKKSVTVGDKSKKNWKIWENYLIVAVKLGNWDDVLYASRVLLNVKRDIDGEGSLDIPILEKLVDLLVSEKYDENKQTFFQRSCTEFVCKMVPSVLDHNARVWRIIARVEFWRGKPWLALEDYEKAYRAVTTSPDLITDENIWNEAVESCSELISAYENFGELPGKYDAGDVICKDWKFKAKSTVRSLISKGKATWEYTDGYERLQDLKKEIMRS